MNRTLLYFPWAHGFKSENEEGFDVHNNEHVKRDYFSIKRYFSSSFWNSYSNLECLYLYVEGVPALELPSIVQSLKERKLHPAGWTVDEYVKNSYSTLTKISQYVYDLPTTLNKSCKFIGLENPLLCLPHNDPVKTLEVEVPQRDMFMANRINETLPHDGVGALFIGHTHNVHHFLPTDIMIEFPKGNPEPDPNIARQLALLKMMRKFPK